MSEDIRYSTDGKYGRDGRVDRDGRMAEIVVLLKFVDFLEIRR